MIFFFFDIEKEYFQDFWRHLPDASATAHETTKTLPNSRPRCAHWWQWIKDSKCAWWAIMNCLLGQHLWRDISDWKFTPRCDWEPLDHLLKNLFWMMNFLMRDKNQWFSMNGGGLETAKIPLKLVTLLWIHVTPGRLPSQQQTNAPGFGTSSLRHLSYVFYLSWFFDEAGLERIPAFEWLISFAASQISGWQKTTVLRGGGCRCLHPKIGEAVYFDSLD